MSFNIDPNFFWSFKKGDNLFYNLRILNYFYDLYNQGDEEQKKLLRKPIVVWLASIVEVVLHDFHVRIRGSSNEGVSNLRDDIINYIKGKKIDEFEQHIASAKKHNLFNRENDVFYDKLNELRLARNRIHIQNSKSLRPEDEDLFFDENVKILAEKCAEIVLKEMSDKYGRPMKCYVKDLCLPWDEHFSSSQI